MADTQRDDLQPDTSPGTASSTDASAAAASATDMGGEASPAPAAVPEPAGPESAAPAAAGAPATTAPESPAAEPTLETSTTVPPLGAGGAAAAEIEGEGEGEGGEWNLLLEKLRQWWRSGELQSLWQQTRTPLTLGLGLITVLLVLRVYAGLLAAINSLPLVPGLLELVGVIWTVRYGVPRLIRRSEREQLLDGLQRRWRSFSGRG
ncbi:MAG: CAAD domain-containing protein [Synechococcaceae cyanobacterium]